MHKNLVGQAGPLAAGVRYTRLGLGSLRRHRTNPGTTATSGALRASASRSDVAWLSLNPQACATPPTLCRDKYFVCRHILILAQQRDRDSCFGHSTVPGTYSKRGSGTTIRGGRVMAGADDHNAFHDDLGHEDESSLMSVCSSLSGAGSPACNGLRSAFIEGN